jgi:HD-GYP domain-containing protein (c-di-GMP phosphodiesterase class II)
MQFSQLASVKHRVVVGSPLPFNVRNADHTLLLAKGHVIGSYDQMEALFQRGALVDLAELVTPADLVRQAPAEALPGLWRDKFNEVGNLLRNASDPGFSNALETATPVVMALIERDRELAIFQVLRQDGNAFVQYGLDHSTHTAITAFLVAQRLGWSDGDMQRVFKAALTMNLSMLELQGQLAQQTSPITAEQRAAIHAHPEQSVQMLKLSGVQDADWLNAVAQHHERSDGSGYPHGLRAINDIAALVQRADVYTAKLSARAGRDPMAADKAGRAMFMQDPGHPMSAALVKEFGVYPPGCFVRLASGETGVVIQRGPTVTTPVVAALTTPNGSMLTEPQRRDTSQREHGIVAIVPAAEPMRRVPAEKLMALAMP